MVATIVEILNARLQLTGFFHTLYCLTEKKREQREGGDFVFPAQYTGSGGLAMIEFDSAGFAYFRKDGNITQSIIDNTLGQTQLYEVNIPLRLVAMVRRADVGGDDAFSPDVLARQIASQLTFKNGDLKTALLAAKTQVNTSSWSTDPEQIWSDETEGTGRIEPDYSRAFIAMSVSVTVTADENCIQNACEADTDILHLFDFCKPSVVARLTDEQVACLEAALCEAPPTLCEQLALVAPENVVVQVFDCLTEAAQTELLDSECVIPPCAPANLQINGVQQEAIASGATFNLIALLDGVADGTYDPATDTLSFTSNTGWIRDPNWIAIPTLTALDERFVGVLAIFENAYNQLAWQITGGGTIDWGDGTSVAITGAVQTKVYDYSTVAGAVNVYHDGRNYKQVLVDITRIGAAFTDFRIAAATVNVGSPCTFLDIAVSLPSCTILALGLNRPIAYAERVLVKSMAAAINTGTLLWVFQGATSLRVWESPTNGINGLLQLTSATAPIDDIGDVTSSVTTAALRYAGSWIKAAGNQTFNTATSIQQMFDGCSMLQSIGNITATSATAGGVAFMRDCKSAHTIGTINCPLWTSLNLFASGCVFLGRLVFTDCSLITVTTSAIANCYSLYYLEMNGLTRGINLSSTALGNYGMNAFANSLGIAAGAQTITVTGTPYGSLLTALDATALAIRAVMTGKGFTVAN